MGYSAAEKYPNLAPRGVRHEFRGTRCSNDGRLIGVLDNDRLGGAEYRRAEQSEDCNDALSTCDITAGHRGMTVA